MQLGGLGINDELPVSNMIIISTLHSIVWYTNIGNKYSLVRSLFIVFLCVNHQYVVLITFLYTRCFGKSLLSFQVMIGANFRAKKVCVTFVWSCRCSSACVFIFQIKCSCKIFKFQNIDASHTNLK